MREKGVAPDAKLLQYLFRGFAGAEKPGEAGRWLWSVALPALQAGAVDRTGANLLLKACLRDEGAPRDQVLQLVAKVSPNDSTAKLLEQLKKAPVIEAAAAAGTSNAAATKQ
jgi:hypothetical protein